MFGDAVEYRQSVCGSWKEMEKKTRLFFYHYYLFTGASQNVRLKTYYRVGRKRHGRVTNLL